MHLYDNATRRKVTIVLLPKHELEKDIKKLVYFICIYK